MSNLIDKLNARDKDERYMAMHDLAADLDRDNIKLENEMERRVVNTILKHLEDSSTDVKQQAVRTIASLARKVQEAQLEDIDDRLATHIINKTDEEKRDIGSIGLKTLVGVLTQTRRPRCSSVSPPSCIKASSWMLKLLTTASRSSTTCSKTLE